MSGGTGPLRSGLRGWLSSIGLTMGLSLLVAAGVAQEERTFAVAVVVAAALGLGVLYRLFPHGTHFAVGTANGFAVYACLYVFMARAGFPEAADWAKSFGFLLPVAAFLAAVWLRRREVEAAAEAQVPFDVAHLPRMMRFVLAVGAVGVVAMMAPEARLPAAAQTAALLAAMAAIAAIVAASVREVVRLLADVALIFEAVAGRAGRLAVPIVAFMTVYSLLVIVFASVYSVADAISGVGLFAGSDGPIRLSFSDALHFSVATLSTVGYGDIRPVGDGVRVLASFQVLAGQLLLLFGFAEIMRGTRDLREQREEGPEDAAEDVAASRGNHSAKDADGANDRGQRRGDADAAA